MSLYSKIIGDREYLEQLEAAVQQGRVRAKFSVQICIFLSCSSTMYLLITWWFIDQTYCLLPLLAKAFAFLLAWLSKLTRISVRGSSECIIWPLKAGLSGLQCLCQNVSCSSSILISKWGSRMLTMHDASLKSCDSKVQHKTQHTSMTPCGSQHILTLYTMCSLFWHLCLQMRGHTDLQIA